MAGAEAFKQVGQNRFFPSNTSGNLSGPLACARRRGPSRSASIRRQSSGPDRAIATSENEARTMTRGMLIFGCTLLVLTTALAADEWPQFRGRQGGVASDNLSDPRSAVPCGVRRPQFLCRI
jgi:hypothetical protein